MPVWSGVAVAVSAAVLGVFAARASPECRPGAEIVPSAVGLYGLEALTPSSRRWESTDDPVAVEPGAIEVEEDGGGVDDGDVDRAVAAFVGEDEGDAEEVADGLRRRVPGAGRQALPIRAGPTARGPDGTAAGDVDGRRPLRAVPWALAQPG